MATRLHKLREPLLQYGEFHKFHEFCIQKSQTKARELIFKYYVMLCHIMCSFDTLLGNGYVSRLESYLT